MELVFIKTIGLVSLLFSSLLFSYLPMIIMRKVSGILNNSTKLFYKRIISLLSCFGGGVFLSVCLMDLFPEVREEMAGALEKLKNPSKFPISEFVMIIGFFLVLIIEQVVLSQKETSEELQPLLGHSHSPDTHSPSLNRRSRSESIEGIRDEPLSSYSTHTDQSSHSSLRTTLLVLALSLHSVFEGLAVGLQPEVSKILQVLVAVLIHKNIIAFTLGLNLVQSKLKVTSRVLSVILFSLMSPVGLAIGMILMNFDKGMEVFLISGILQGVACGTFLYVTFFEILPHELNNSTDRLLKLLCIVIGFTTVAVLILFLPD